MIQRVTATAATMVQCVKLMLRIFEFGVLLFDGFVYRQNVTCLKSFTRYGHYAGDNRKTKSQADLQLSVKSLCQKLEY